jgi:hypothetical protein
MEQTVRVKIPLQYGYEKRLLLKRAVYMAARCFLHIN